MILRYIIEEAEEKKAVLALVSLVIALSMLGVLIIMALNN